MKPYAYQFTRRVNNRTWQINIESADGLKVDITFQAGMSPHWMVINGMCLDYGSSSGCIGFQCTRIQALRYAACGIANMHGGGIGSGGNMPHRPYRIWSPKRLRQLIRDTPPTGPWIEFDAVNFESRKVA